MTAPDRDLELALDRVEFAKAVGLYPDDWQDRLLRSDSKRVLLNISRQAGKSTLSALIALHRALYFPGSLILVLSPSLRQSQELFIKTLNFFRELDSPPPTQSETKLSLHFQNGSRIVSLPGTEAKIRGFSNVALLILDEAARIGDELYLSVRPMLAVSGGTIMMLSTPFGKRGVFFEEFSEGVGWERYEVTADQVPRISAEFLEEERASLGPVWFAQEYQCTFGDTINSVFRTEDIERAFTDDIQPLWPERQGAA